MRISLQAQGQIPRRSDTRSSFVSGEGDSQGRTGVSSARCAGRTGLDASGWRVPRPHPEGTGRSRRGSDSSEASTQLLPWKPYQLSAEKSLCFVFKNALVGAQSVILSSVPYVPIATGVEGERLLRAQGASSRG